MHTNISSYVTPLLQCLQAGTQHCPLHIPWHKAVHSYKLGANINVCKQWPLRRVQSHLHATVPTTRLCPNMPNLQNQSSEALEQRTSLEGIELTSLPSVHSRTTTNDDDNASDQHKSIVSSTDALDRPLDTEYAGIASQSLPRWSVFEDPWGAWSSRVRNLGSLQLSLS